MSKIHSLVSSDYPSYQDIFCGLMIGLETHSFTAKEDRLTAKELSKHGGTASEMAGRMLACEPGGPCGSGACRKCLKKAREQLIPQVARRLRRVLKKQQEIARKKGLPKPRLLSVSAADGRQSVPLHCLSVKAVTSRMTAIRQAIIRSQLKCGIIFGGLDISLNVLLPKGSEPVWQPHLYLLIISTLPDESVRQVFEPYFPPMPNQRNVPIRIAEVRDEKDIPRCVSYVFKSEFSRRESYKDKRNRTQTSDNTLLRCEKSDLALFLDELGIGKRLLMRGLKIIKGKVTATTLCPQHSIQKVESFALKHGLCPQKQGFTGPRRL